MIQQEFQTRYKYNPSADCIGEGGFGKVYKAYDTHLDKWVAIKVAEVKPGQEQVRLKKEVEMVSKLPTHPNIANYEACYTFTSFTGDYDFAVLQYYEEGNLQQLIDSVKLNQTQKEALLRQILEGVGFLHNQDIIHRDLKPQNILIAKRNDEYIPKITDFGISKKLDFNNSSVFTNSLAGAGTMAYASPEQLLGKTIKKNTDLWSFGVIVCQVFTGKLPFSVGRDGINSEAGRIELFKQIVNGTISFSNNSIPANWQQLIKKCIVVDNNVRATKAEICFGFVKKKSINNFEKHSESDFINEKYFEIVWNGGYCGFQNLNGEMITDYKYDFALKFSNGLAVVELNGQWGYVDTKGKEVIPLQYQNCHCFVDGIAIVKKDNKYGYIDILGKLLTPIKYDYCHDFNDKFAIVRLNNNYGLIDRNGNEICYYKYDSIGPFSFDLAKVRLNSKYGFIDINGNEVIPLKYREAENFADCGLAKVLSSNFKHLFIDKKGKEAFLNIYKTVGSFSEGLLPVILNGRFGYIDKNGLVKIPIKYDYAYDFCEGFAMVQLNGKFGFVNKSGNEIIQLKYDDAGQFNYGLAKVKKNNKWGFIDFVGDEIIPLKYDDVWGFDYGLAPVYLSGKYGFIDKKGNEVSQIIYTNIDGFCNGLVPVELNGKWGVINMNGEVIIQIEYGKIDISISQYETLIYAKIIGSIFDKWIVFDRYGKRVTQKKYDEIKKFDLGLAIVRLGLKYGFIDLNGNEIIPLKYDNVNSFSDGLAKVKLNGKWGYIDKANNEIIPIIYDKIEFEGNYSFPLFATLDSISIRIDRNGNRI